MRFGLVMVLLVGCFDSEESKIESDLPDSNSNPESANEPSTETPSTNEPETNEPETNEPSSSEETQEDYPTGPFGWTPSMFWDQQSGSGYWTTDGSTIENICLPNAAGSQVCLKDFYRSSSKDIIFLDFLKIPVKICLKKRIVF